MQHEGKGSDHEAGAGRGREADQDQQRTIDGPTDRRLVQDGEQSCDG